MLYSVTTQNPQLYLMIPPRFQKKKKKSTLTKKIFNHTQVTSAKSGVLGTSQCDSSHNTNDCNSSHNTKHTTTITSGFCGNVGHFQQLLQITLTLHFLRDLRCDSSDANGGDERWGLFIPWCRIRLEKNTKTKKKKKQSKFRSLRWGMFFRSRVVFCEAKMLYEGHKLPSESNQSFSNKVGPEDNYK